MGETSEEGPCEEEEGCVCAILTHNVSPLVHMPRFSRPFFAHVLYLFRRLIATAGCSSVGSTITFSQARLRECAHVELEKNLLLDTLREHARAKLEIVLLLDDLGESWSHRWD